MMCSLKEVLICVTILVKFHYVLSQNQTTDTYLTHFLIKIYQKRCDEATGNVQHFQDLKDRFNRLHEKYLTAIQDLPDCVGYFCGEIRTELMYATAEIRKYIKACRGDRELSNVLISSFEGLLEFLCYNNGNYTTRIRYYSTETQQCKRKIESPNNTEVFSHCFKPFVTGLAQEKTPQICELIKVFKICLNGRIIEVCEGGKQVQDLNGRFFNIITRPCNGVWRFSSSILIITILNFFY